jgi:hypothetical protein
MKLFVHCTIDIVRYLRDLISYNEVKVMVNKSYQSYNRLVRWSFNTGDCLIEVTSYYNVFQITRASPEPESLAWFLCTVYDFIVA